MEFKTFISKEMYKLHPAKQQEINLMDAQQKKLASEQGYANNESQDIMQVSACESKVLINGPAKTKFKTSDEQI